jgi:hypothetical protein
MHAAAALVRPAACTAAHGIRTERCGRAKVTATWQQWACSMWRIQRKRRSRPSLAPWPSAYFVTASGSDSLHLFLYRHVFLVRQREAPAKGRRGCHPEDLKHLRHPIVPLRAPSQGPTLCHHRRCLGRRTIHPMGADFIFKVCQTASHSFSQGLPASRPVTRGCC